NRRVMRETTGLVVPEQVDTARSRLGWRADDHEIQEAVVVEIAEDGGACREGAQRCERRAAAIGFKGPVPAVVVEDGGHSARRSDEQVEEPVVIVVADRDRRGVALRSALRQAARRGRILEAAL